jgi:hypothetical protein
VKITISIFGLPGGRHFGGGEALLHGLFPAFRLLPRNGAWRRDSLAVPGTVAGLGAVAFIVDCNDSTRISMPLTGQRRTEEDNLRYLLSKSADAPRPGAPIPEFNTPAHRGARGPPLPGSQGWSCSTMCATDSVDSLSPPRRKKQKIANYAGQKLL